MSILKPNHAKLPENLARSSSDCQIVKQHLKLPHLTPFWHHPVSWSRCSHSALLIACDVLTPSWEEVLMGFRDGPLVWNMGGGLNHLCGADGGCAADRTICEALPQPSVSCHSRGRPYFWLSRRKGKKGEWREEERWSGNTASYPNSQM